MTPKTLPSNRQHIRSDRLFYICLAMLGGSYVLLIVLLLTADIAYMLRGSSWEKIVFDSPLVQALGKPEIRFSILLSLISCSLSAVLSLFVAVPLGYLLARTQFFGRRLVSKQAYSDGRIALVLAGNSWVDFLRYDRLIASAKDIQLCLGHSNLLSLAKGSQLIAASVPRFIR